MKDHVLHGWFGFLIFEIAHPTVIAGFTDDWRSSIQSLCMILAQNILEVVSLSNIEVPTWVQSPHPCAPDMLAAHLGVSQAKCAFLYYSSHGGVIE
jgi:hypothetical protein